MMLGLQGGAGEDLYLLVHLGSVGVEVALRLWWVWLDQHLANLLASAIPWFSIRKRTSAPQRVICGYLVSPSSLRAFSFHMTLFIGRQAPILHWTFRAIHMARLPARSTDNYLRKATVLQNVCLA